MKTKRPLPKRFSGTARVSGILAGLALLLTVASAAIAAPFAYVSKDFSDPGQVFVIDIGAPTAAPVPVRVGSNPGGIAINRAGTRAYVANTDANSVSVIHTATVNTANPVVETIANVGTAPTSVALSQDDSKLYVGTDGTVAIYNTSDNSPAVVPPIPADGALSSIAVVGSVVYATTFTGEVVVVETNPTSPNYKSVKSIFVSTNLKGIAVNPSGSRVYVANGDMNGDLWVTVINPRLSEPTTNPTIAATVPIGLADIESGFSPGALAISPSGERVYLTIPNEDAVVAINTADNSLVCPSPTTDTPPRLTGICARLAPDAEPFGIAFDPNDSTGASVFVVHRSDGRVSAINTTTHAVANPTPVTGFSSAFGAFITSGPPPLALKLRSSPPEAGTFMVDKLGPYPAGTDVTVTAGTDVTVTATAKPGFQFVSWSSDPLNASCSGAVVSCKVTMSANTTVTATFTPVYALTLKPEPPEGGSIAATTAGPYPSGNIVTVKVTKVNPGFQFTGWSSNPFNATCSGNVVQCKVTMNAATTVTATFTATPPPPPPAPTTCDDKIRDLEKKVATDKAPWRHDHQLKAALRLYRAAQVELENAKKKVGGNDKRYVRAMSEFNKGKGALCSGHYWRAHHELWESYYIAHEILKHHHRR